ncbi:hypothetical protein PHMEG_00017955 [Phytophthora megakarya]|uniref:Uncharacterized protein n=1 Tax=Phytophthora megakarya TaxID=4795 RepID=A0A225VVA9_9STRA|nr:hypothetical protein PHMEG_00017955 [Phytophthora megakarya]
MWTDRIGLALQGARESGRGEWSGHALYFILGNILIGEAANWWKPGRYGEDMDPPEAGAFTTIWVERRYLVGGVSSEHKNPRSQGASCRLRCCIEESGWKTSGERTSADGSILPRNGQDDSSTDLEEAVIKAAEIDDPMENLVDMAVVTGNASSAVTQSEQTAGNDATTRTVALPGVGNMYVSPSGATAGIKNYAAVDPDGLVLYTNPKGAWNIIAGKYELPVGRKWNSRYWDETTNKRRAQVIRSPTPSTANEDRGHDEKRNHEPRRARKAARHRREEDSSDDEKPKPRKKTKPKRTAASSEDERDTKPQKKLKAVVRQILAE